MALRTRASIHQNPALFPRDDHYPVFRLDIRKDRKLSSGYEYPLTAFKRVTG